MSDEEMKKSKSELIRANELRRLDSKRNSFLLAENHRLKASNENLKVENERLNQTIISDHETATAENEQLKNKLKEFQEAAEKSRVSSPNVCKLVYKDFQVKNKVLLVKNQNLKSEKNDLIEEYEKTFSM